MTTVKQLFPDRWLHPSHLRNQAHQVAIEAVTIEELWNPRSRVKEPKAVLAFHGKPLRLPLNKTQAFTLANITRTPEIEQWVGHEIVLAPGIAPNRSATITLSAPANRQTPAPSANGAGNNGQPPKDPPVAPPPAPDAGEPENEPSDKPDDTPNP